MLARREVLVQTCLEACIKVEKAGGVVCGAKETSS